MGGGQTGRFSEVQDCVLGRISNEPKSSQKKWLTFVVSFSFDCEASLILVARLPRTIQFQLKLEPIQFVLCKLDFLSGAIDCGAVHKWHY